MAEIRSFIAIELPSKIKTELSGLVGRLSPKYQRSVKWVNPEGIHLTLKFLGSVPEEKISDIIDVLDDIASESHPFELCLDEVGAFPNLKSPRVAWVGISGNLHDLSSIHRKIENSIVHLGFEKEKRVFSAHLTIGRVKDSTNKIERADIGRDLSVSAIKQSLPFSINGFTLMKSTLTPKGAIYEQIACFTLDNERNIMIELN